VGGDLHLCRTKILGPVNILNYMGVDINSKYYIEILNIGESGRMVRRTACHLATGVQRRAGSCEGPRR
jgi:hypothetical protein